ncbi:MAG TPA: hypothetical protein VEA40_22555 [Ramlibacter sp.]|nr:hypothetical protein [Ramlibacter sp.]
MTLREFLHVTFKRRIVVASFIAAALLGGFAGLKLVAPTYEATGRLLVRIGQEDMYMPVLPTSQSRMPVMNVVREEQLRSESNILEDPQLARLVVKDLTPQVLFPGIDTVHAWYTPRGVLQRLTEAYGAIEDYFAPLTANRTLEDRAVARFQGAVTAEAVKRSNVIEVSMRNKSPEAAASGVNTLLKHYLDARARIYQREQTGFFAQQLEQVDDQLRDAEARLEAFRRNGQVLDLDRQRAAQVDNLNDVRRRLDETRVALGQSGRSMEVLRRQLDEIPATTLLAGGETSNGLAASEMSKQLAEVRRRQVEIGKHFRDSDPRLVSLGEERQLLEGFLAQQRQSRDVSMQQGINPLHARIRDNLMQAEATSAGLRQTLGSLTALEAEITRRLDKFNSQDSGYQQLVQQVKVLRDARQLYIEKTEESRLAAQQAAARAGNVSIVSLASPPTQPASPRLWLVLTGVLIGAVVGGIGLAFLLEFIDDSLRSDGDVRRYLKLPVLAKVPQLAV